MKTETVKDVFGNPIKVMTPENAADERVLAEMERDGEADLDESFADRPESLPLEEVVNE